MVFVVVALDGGRGWPAGPNLFYECLICGDFVASKGKEPNDYVFRCGCSNVEVDVGSARMSVRECDNVILWQRSVEPAP